VVITTLHNLQLQPLDCRVLPVNLQRSWLVPKCRSLQPSIKQDVETLVEYIYTALGMDLDYILPFSSIPENGREIDGLDDRSELAHRMTLVNLLRILGAVKIKKASRHFVTHPTQVILPLSANRGLFGNDGLYSESKISLETLFQRWASESWGEYLALLLGMYIIFVTTLYANIVSVGREGQVSWRPRILLRMNSKSSG